MNAIEREYFLSHTNLLARIAGSVFTGLKAAATSNPQYSFRSYTYNLFAFICIFCFFFSLHECKHC